MAMPTGTRSSMSAKRTMKPMTATLSALMGEGPVHQGRSGACPQGGHTCRGSFDGLQRHAAEAAGLEDQAPCPDRDQENGRYIPHPGDREERPGRQMQIIGEHII